MKYVIIPYIALGLVLSLIIGIEYKCEGQEMFPSYYGSPFVFKQKSLASSMEYFYSILGLIGNVLVWSLILFLLDKIIQTAISKIKKQQLIYVFYKIMIGLLIVFATLNIVIEFTMTANGFEPGLNYWYWDIDKEAKDWGIECKGKIVMLKK